MFSKNDDSLHHPQRSNCGIKHQSKNPWLPSPGFCLFCGLLLLYVSFRVNSFLPQPGICLVGDFFGDCTVGFITIVHHHFGNMFGTFSFCIEQSQIQATRGCKKATVFCQEAYITKVLLLDGGKWIREQLQPAKKTKMTWLWKIHHERRCSSYWKLGGFPASHVGF